MKARIGPEVQQAIEDHWASPEGKAQLNEFLDSLEDATLEIELTPEQRRGLHPVHRDDVLEA